MRRYHFSIAGAAGQLGLVGALFAQSDQQAIAMLDEILGLCEGATILDHYRGQEPDVAGVVEATISYVNLATNGLRASIAMFDDIEGDDLAEGAGVDADAAVAIGAAEPAVASSLPVDVMIAERGSQNDAADAYSFVDGAPEGEMDVRCWELLVNGVHTEWTLYELHAASPYYSRGPYGFIENNSEPQFAHLDEAQAALIAAWNRANGTRSVD